MPNTESSQPRETESQRFDQAPGSSKNEKTHIRDFIEHESRLYDEQHRRGKEKDIMTQEVEA
jgi:hypothetical protein